jgi:hypothetical protein
MNGEVGLIIVPTVAVVSERRARATTTCVQEWHMCNSSTKVIVGSVEEKEAVLYDGLV